MGINNCEGSAVENVTIVALDLETTGKYPLGAEICEIAMIKFDHTGILDRFESLVRPRGEMGAEAERIHGLSLESLKDAPLIKDVLPEVVEFMSGSPLLGHNLPFDLGFLAYEFDHHLEDGWWEESFTAPNFCTSLISLQTHPKLTTHRLKYLSEYFEVENSPNHRAMQDTQSCMEVFLKLTKDVKNIEELVAIQKDALLFTKFSLNLLMKEKPNFKGMVEACKKSVDFDLMYSKGSKKNKWRKLTPKGLVMKTKEEGFVVGVDTGEIQTKRFMLGKILETRFPSVQPTSLASEAK